MPDQPTPDETRAELVLLRRVVARHIADSYASHVPAAEALALSLHTEIEAAGLDLTAELHAARRAVVTRSLRHRPATTTPRKGDS